MNRFQELAVRRAALNAHFFASVLSPDVYETAHALRCSPERAYKLSLCPRPNRFRTLNVYARRLRTFVVA